MVEADLFTVIKEIQTVVNSRPLTHIEDDLSTDTLTPNKLLYGRDIFLSPILHNPQDDEEWNAPRPNNMRQAYKTTVQAIRQFHKSFRNQYLTTLKLQRQPVRGGSPYQPRVGEVVLVASEKHRQDWPLARVTQVFPSSDGVIRSVQLYDGSSYLVRDPRQLLNLECDLRQDLPEEETTAEDSHLETPHIDEVRSELPQDPAQSSRIQEAIQEASPTIDSTSRTPPEATPTDETTSRPKREAARRQRRMMQTLHQELIDDV